MQEKSPKITEGGQQGNISIRSISFKYPSRNNYTFKNLSMNISPGSKVALVGPSGCGKSTIIQMLQRFYDPEEGEILLDGRNLKDYDIYYLRKLFGVVSQEPVLFNDSFRNNIRYNMTWSMDEDVRVAAEKANALQFIEGAEPLEKKEEEEEKVGFDRSVGVKGSHISGGQKQRVAIARSILRDPKILLLD